MAWSKTSRHQRGYGTAWDRLRRVILARDKYLCQPCKREGRLTEGRIVDHIKNKAKGGTDDPDNLQVICAECNREKVAIESGRPLKPRRTFDESGWPIE